MSSSCRGAYWGSATRFEQANMNTNTQLAVEYQNELN